MRWRLSKLAVRTVTRTSSHKALPIIRIENGTFYRKYPSDHDVLNSNPPLFPSLKFELSSITNNNYHWAVIGPSNSGQTTFFEILRGQHISIPHTARSFPFLSSPDIDRRYKSPLRAIQYVGFNGGRDSLAKAGARGAYLSARYESRREETDFTVNDYLKGNTELNSGEKSGGDDRNDAHLSQVVKELKLESLMNMPLSNLSNGQTRRARIAQALMSQPLVLLLDEPFMGLDPLAVSHLSNLLYDLAAANAPKIMISLRSQDAIPLWITHILRLEAQFRISYAGPKPMESAQDAHRKQFARDAPITRDQCATSGQNSSTVRPVADESDHSLATLAYGTGGLSREGLPLNATASAPVQEGKVLMSMKGVEVSYGENVVLGNWTSPRTTGNLSSKNPDHGLWWDVRRGQRWGIFGSNGSGKTTLISLICSDHPQAYSQPVEIFGRSRLPRPGAPGISIFDIQSRIGQSSPEVHAFFPKQLTIRQTLRNAWADTFLGTPQLTSAARDRVEKCLRWFEKELNPAFHSRHAMATSLTGSDWADAHRFGQIPFSAQRVALFLRAIIKSPDLVVLDEAFSGMDEYVRDKCSLFLTWGETRSYRENFASGATMREIVVTSKTKNDDSSLFPGLSQDQALICVSHVKEEVPAVVRHWLRLPEPGAGEPPKFGLLDRPLQADDGSWANIWGL